MKLQNKILLILFIAFSFILFFNISSVKAANPEYISFNYKNVDYNIKTDSSIDVSNGVYINLYNGKLYICVKPSSDCYFYNYNKHLCCNIGMQEYYYNQSNSSWSKTQYWEGGSSTTRPDLIYMAYSSADIYTDETKTDLFFQVPVVEEEPTQEITGVIAPLLEKEEMEKANLQIRVIIPLIIVVVVSFLGLRKALKMLSQILHRS